MLFDLNQFSTLETGIAMSLHVDDARDQTNVAYKSTLPLRSLYLRTMAALPLKYLVFADSKKVIQVPTQAHQCYY